MADGLISFINIQPTMTFPCASSPQRVTIEQRHNISFVLLLLLILLSAHSFSQQSLNNIPLLIDAGDLIEINVFDTPELSGKFRVDNQGSIKLPVGGSLDVKGLSSEQAAAKVELALREADVLHDPHVSVLVSEYATQGISVLGEVKTPGVYPLQGQHGILDFISVAGGLTPSAAKTVTLIRKDAPDTAVAIDLNAPVSQLTAANVAVRPGDRIIVSRAGLVYVLGDVGKPGGYVIDNPERITLLQALALAQGVNKTAKSSASLIRSTATVREETVLSLKKVLTNDAADPKLQDGDIIYVPMSAAKNWSEKSMTAILQMAVGVVIYGRY